MAPTAVAVVLVIKGNTHTDRHTVTVVVVDTLIKRAFWVTTSRVAMLIARMEKSVACTENCSIHPLATHDGESTSLWSRIYIEPLTTLAMALMKSAHPQQLAE